MLQKINKVIAENGIWIFLCALTYRLVFYVIDIVSAFKWSAGGGVRCIFEGLFGIAVSMVTLVVLLEVSRKVASSYAPTQPTQNRPYNAPMPNQQPRPVQGGAAGWFCASCGAQNNDGMAFCAKCGRPKQ